jgi:hypothetical protein
VTVDQQQAPVDFTDAGADWQVLADSYAVSGGTLTVTLASTPDGFVEADAVRIERVGLPPRPADHGGPGFGTAGLAPAQAQRGPGVFPFDVHSLAPGGVANPAPWTFPGLPAGIDRGAAIWSAYPLPAMDAPVARTDRSHGLGGVTVDQRRGPASPASAGALGQVPGLFPDTSDPLRVKLSD